MSATENVIPRAKRTSWKEGKLRSGAKESPMSLVFTTAKSAPIAGVNCRWQSQ